jgi:hypothetical protein
MGEYDEERLASTRPRDRAGRRRPGSRREPRRHGTARGGRLLHDVGVRRWRTGATVTERDVERVHPVMQATSVPRRHLVPGAVVLARVPFEPEGSEPFESPEDCQDKVRPVVVVEAAGDEYVCRACTSATSRLRYPWAYSEIQDLAAAGLTRPTGVRLRRSTLPRDACIEVCGALGEADRTSVLDEGPAACMPDAVPTGGAGDGHAVGV